MSVTLQEISEELGVSRATVSRALGPQAHLISEATRRRVQDAAHKVGYRPNRMARALTTGRTHTVGVWMNKLHTPHSARIVGIMQRLSASYGYDTLISRRLWTGLAQDWENVAALPTDGVFAMDFGIYGMEDEVKRLRHAENPAKPLVSMGAFWLPDTDYVGVDLYPARRAAVEHLLATGRRRIAYVDHRDGHAECRHSEPSFLQHDRAYAEAMEQAGLATDYVLAPDPSRKAVFDAVSSHFSSRVFPEAFLCHDDEMAIAVMCAVRGAGLRIPDDVAVIGCDDIEECEYHDPPLATIVQPVEDMCKRAWTFMKNRLIDPGMPLQQQILTAEFVARPSAGGITRKGRKGHSLEAPNLTEKVGSEKLLTEPRNKKGNT